MDARTKAVKTHRKRLRTRGLKRVEVSVPARDADLVRDFASVLRNGGAGARLLASSVKQITGDKDGRTIAEVMAGAPDISGPELDAVFDEIERLRHDPVVQKVRDIDL